jgi:hypothetical protein
MDYLSFYLFAAWALLHLARRGDVVVAKTDSPMLSILVAALEALRGFKRVNWLQDLYPEIAIELGVASVRGLWWARPRRPPQLFALPSGVERRHWRGLGGK